MCSASRADAPSTVCVGPQAGPFRTDRRRSASSRWRPPPASVASGRHPASRQTAPRRARPAHATLPGRRGRGRGNPASSRPRPAGRPLRRPAWRRAPVPMGRRQGGQTRHRLDDQPALADPRPEAERFAVRRECLPIVSTVGRHPRQVRQRQGGAGVVADGAEERERLVRPAFAEVEVALTVGDRAQRLQGHRPGARNAACPFEAQGLGHQPSARSQRPRVSSASPSMCTASAVRSGSPTSRAIASAASADGAVTSGSPWA